MAKSPKTAKIKYWRYLKLAIVYGKGYDVIFNCMRNPRRTTCNAAKHVKFFVTEHDNGVVGFADFTIQKL